MRSTKPHANLLNGVIILALLMFFPYFSFAENLVFVVIDGARYTETLGDPTRQYIPEMGTIADHGAYLDAFYNDNYTFTSRAIPALWCGSWTDVTDTTVQSVNTQYANDPTIFEYYRKQTGAPADSCVYVLKYISSLWLPSYHPEYGPDYWPMIHSEGSSDTDVLNETFAIMQENHPQLLWVYLADVDHYGHLGVWENYVGAISRADSLVGALWEAIQADPIYRDNTTMVVTNDHGRHTDYFSGHGCGCDGCRHIMYLVAGPRVNEGFVSDTEYVLPDAMVTAASVLGIETEYSTGSAVTELFRVTGINESAVNLLQTDFTLHPNYPNPFNPATTIHFSIASSGVIDLSVYDIAGRRVLTVLNQWCEAGDHRLIFNGSDLPSGVYLCQLRMEGVSRTTRMLLLK